MKQNNIFPPAHQQMLKRSDKESLLKQQGVLIWFTGLSGSGKTTLAIALEKELFGKGYLTCILDGDNMRSGINANLGFSEEDRMENIRRIAETGKLLVECGIITIVACISPTEKIRAIPRFLFGKDDLVEIFISAPVDVCETRDVKGLYRKARSGEIKEFTGVSAPFEYPENPDMVLDTSILEIGECVSAIMNLIKQKEKLCIK
ncbi:MAG: adenylyl-sulfate kinase [Candidatus Azobacteroides sp.]|nr:adenylyl-sulfate kinase [Candidatus Azobacteroides sp.]